MSGSLYTPDILRLAMSIGDHPRLTHADASEEGRAPVCGSRVCVDVAVDGAGTLCAIGLDVHACAMGQAAAALFAADCAGRTAENLSAIAVDLAEWMMGARDAPPDWPRIDLLAPARAYPARHAAILLPFRVGALALRRAVGAVAAPGAAMGAAMDGGA
ncbi:MAG: iron-sulfur cluster assembly scaffold protein [Sphingopyxis sp.]